MSTRKMKKFKLSKFQNYPSIIKGVYPILIRRSRKERMILEKGQVRSSSRTPEACFIPLFEMLLRIETIPLVDGETNGFAISESRIDACLRFIEEGAVGWRRRAAGGGEISVRVKFN